MENRKYNIDLLRIISIIFIILSHYVYHGNIVESSNLSVNIWIALLISICGKLGANIFILISGFFYKENKLKISKILKMDLKVIFYSLGICFISKLFSLGEVSLKNVITSIIPITTGLYWFFTAFIGLYLISPILNHLIISMNKYDIKKIIIVGFIILSIIPTFTSFDPWYSDILWFMYVYLVGAYIRLYNDNKYDKYYKILTLILTIVIFILTLVIYYLSFEFKFLKKGIYHFTAITSSFLFVLSVLYLLIFKDITIKRDVFKKIIKIITPHLLYVYILHDHPLVREKIWNWLKCNEMCDSWYMFLSMIFSTIFIFIITILIDIAFDIIFNKINFSKIDNLFNKIKAKLLIEK